MSKSIKLSPKHGVNPTIPICFWCGKEKNEIALLGRIGGKEDREAPKNAIIDFEPCEECKNKLAMGVPLIEVTVYPNRFCNVKISPGSYPTGRWLVITQEAAKRLFQKDYRCSDPVLVEDEVFKMILPREDYGNE